MIKEYDNSFFYGIFSESCRILHLDRFSKILYFIIRLLICLSLSNLIPHCVVL